VRELVAIVRNSVTIDWSLREPLWAPSPELNPIAREEPRRFEPIRAPAMIEMIVAEFVDSYRSNLEPPSRAYSQ
jgi:hypothetical protein